MSNLCKPLDGSLPGSSVHGILQVGILEWVAIPCSRRSSQPRDQPRDWTWVSYITGILFIIWAIKEAPKIKNKKKNNKKKPLRAPVPGTDEKQLFKIQNYTLTLKDYVIVS